MRRQLEKELASCKHVRICPYTEPSKIIISVKNTNFTGKQLYDLLREKYHLQLEMACETYALAMLSMMDTQEGIRRLVAALKDIDSESISEKAPDFTSVSECWNPARKLPLYEAYMQESCEVPLADAIGRTAAEFVNLYPPGIPLLVPGERIEEPFVRAIQDIPCRELTKVRFAFCNKINNNGMSIFMQTSINICETLFIRLCSCICRELF